MSQEDAISSRSFVVLLSMVRSVPLGLVFIPGVRSGVKICYLQRHLLQRLPFPFAMSDGCICGFLDFFSICRFTCSCVNTTSTECFHPRHIKSSLTVECRTNS